MKTIQQIITRLNYLEKNGKQIQKGFKTDEAKAAYINQLNPFLLYLYLYHIDYYFDNLL